MVVSVMKIRVFRALGRIVLGVAVGVTVLGLLLAQPTLRRNPPSTATVDPHALRVHVEMLSQTFYPRDWFHVENLARTAEYIAGQFAEAGATVEFQNVEAMGRTYRNVIGRFGVGQPRKIIVGAHYDACEDTPGADDNASGVAALIELARLMGRAPPPHEVELVAYVLEEPPFFRTAQMGSFIHAARAAEERERILGVIVLEMVGYFSDRRGSQSAFFGATKK